MKNVLIRIPNSIFDYKLKATELLVLVYMLTIKHTDYYFSVTQGTLASRLNLSVGTIKNVIKSLEQKKILQVKRTKRNGRYLTSEYKLNISIGKNDFFCVGKDIFKYKYELKATSIQVYLFLRRCANNDSDMAFPSLNKIANALHISKTTVIASRKQLEKTRLVKKFNYIKKNKSFGCNRHKIKLNVIKKIKFNKTYKVVREDKNKLLRVDNTKIFPPLEFDFYLII